MGRIWPYLANTRASSVKRGCGAARGLRALCREGRTAWRRVMSAVLVPVISSILQAGREQFREFLHWLLWTMEWLPTELAGCPRLRHARSPPPLLFDQGPSQWLPKRMKTPTLWVISIHRAWFLERIAGHSCCAMARKPGTTSRSTNAEQTTRSKSPCLNPLRGEALTFLEVLLTQRHHLLHELLRRSFLYANSNRCERHGMPKLPRLPDHSKA